MCPSTSTFLKAMGNGYCDFITFLPDHIIFIQDKVVINGPRPYLNFTTHRVTYAKYKGNNGRQVIIKNSNDPKYYVVKGHPKYNGGNNGNGKGNGNGGGKGKGKKG
jgi:hypothetical protein